MSSFKEDPVLTLDTIEEVRQAIETPDWRKNLGTNWCLVKSAWVIGLIDEIDATGQYPYNAVVKKLAEQRLGYPPKPEYEYSNEGDALSALVYNAQGYRRSDKFKADGYEPFTQSLIAKTGVGGKLTTPGGTEMNIRVIEGRLYAMKKGARKFVVFPNGEPVKAIKKGKPEPAPKIGDRAELLVSVKARKGENVITLTIGTTGTIEELSDDQFVFRTDHEEAKTFVSAYEVRIIPKVA